MATLLSGGNSKAVNDGAPTVANVSIEARLGFLRKVYTLFTVGVGVAAIGAVAGFQLLPTVSPLLLLIGYIAAFAAVYFLRHVPTVNVIALMGFCFASGLLTTPLLAGTLASKGITVGLANIITAFGGTVMGFGGLTAYVFITRKDFSWMGGFLYLGLFGLIGFMLLSFLLPMFGLSFSVSPMMAMGFNVFGLVLFSLFVLYDTSMILKHYAETEYIMAALVLFFDFILMFKYLLRLLNSRD